MANWHKLRSMVQDMVDKGVTSVEDIHKRIADMPFSALEDVTPISDSAKSVHEAHDKTVGGVYETIRMVNRKVGEFAQEFLDSVDDARDGGDENY
ncbi:MAG: hypothetical protein ACLFOY_18960 [Desulfatibacillaceae bacterium]